MWDLKKKNDKLSLLTKQKQTHRHRKQTYGCQRGNVDEGRRDTLVVWDQRHRHTHKIGN